VCDACGYFYSLELSQSRCGKCGGELEYVWDEEYLKSVEFTGEFKFWRYKPVIPPVQKQISLGEGGTPLQKSQRLAEHLGLKELFLKDETRNPTNSFKDRAAALIVSDAVGKGYSSIICATNGNHGASLAAYSAKTDLNCHLIVPKRLDLGKLAQMMIYDAQIVESGETIEDSIKKAVTLEHEMSWYQATTELNPLSIEAVKTISYEIVEQGGAPDWLLVAMGSGVTATSLWKGFREMEIAGKINTMPKLIGVQAAGCSPITQAFFSDSEDYKHVEKSDTEAIAIRVIDPMFGSQALRAIRESHGFAVTVTDEEMIQAGKDTARLEGIFPEPASASTIACLRQLNAEGRVCRDDKIVCVITSSGLKTDDILQNISKRHKSPGLGSMLTTKEKILRLVLGGETYGYEVWKSLGKGMTIGAVYQQIADLEKRGLVSSSLKGKRRYYEITERGRRVLEALNDLQALL
jgi:threonine synthase